MGSITTAYNIMVAICNDDAMVYSPANGGTLTSYVSGEMNLYSQDLTLRRGNKSSASSLYRYWDCSSLVSYALYRGSFFDSCPWFGTANMTDYLMNAGFKRYSPSIAWQKGDVMWKSGHTEMVYDPTNYLTMGAHTSNTAYADQVSIGSGSTKNYWTYLFRCGAVVDSDIDYEWQAKDSGGYTDDSSEALNNAVCGYQVGSELGWTMEAFCGIWGNVYVESGYNPWRWGIDNVQSKSSYQSFDGGYGLVQYTPASKYIDSSYATSLSKYAPNFSDSSGKAYDGDAQLRFIDGAGGWIESSGYPYSWKEFKGMTLSPDKMADIFLYNYERPADPEASRSLREQAALYWYDVLANMDIYTKPKSKRSKLLKHTMRPDIRPVDKWHRDDSRQIY